jgi:glycosyl transferase family 87
MVWRQGSHDAYDSEKQPSPWRKGREFVTAEGEAELFVEKWDDEIPQPSRADEMAAAARRAGEQFGPATRHIGNLALFVLAVIGAAAGVAVAYMHVVGDPLNDARAYYDAAARLNAGQALYPPGIDPSTNRIYLYPPLLAMLLRPLALLPYEWFAVIWEIFVVTCFVLLVRHLGVRRRATWIWIGILGVPIGWALAVAQAHIPMTLLIALGQPWSIALAANIKLFPVLIALWWLGRREFEAVAAFAMWSVLFVLAQVLLEQGGSFAYFQRVGFEQIGEGTIRNFSPFVLSPVIWASLLFVGVIATLALARTKWGWAVAVTFATLAPPRLLVYMLASIVAAVRQPRLAHEPDPEAMDDVAAVYTRSYR